MTTSTTSNAPTKITNGNDFTGTLTLLRFMLRRDRIRLPSWALGLTLFMAYCVAGIDGVLETDEDLESLATFAHTPIGALLGGPGIGFDNLTLERFLMGQYGLYILIGASVLGILTIVRHTRVEERTGRAELVRANVLGRHAHLTAALLMAAITSVLAAGLIAALFIGNGFDSHSSLLFATGIAACAMAFAGIASITVQLSEFPRAASGIGSALLGAAFILRGLGDMAAIQGNGLSWLSWLSPIGWSQQTGPFVYDRWWPLALTLAFAAATTTVGYVLSSRRDLDAGLLPPRLGSPVAAAWLNSTPALAFRLQRANLLGWTSGLFLAGLVFGFFAQPMLDGLDDAPEDLVAMFGADGGILDGYLGMMSMLTAFIVAAYAILAVQSLRSEETDGRTEPVLATAVSRHRWLGSNLGVAAVGALWLLLVMGVGLGIGTASSTGDSSLFGDMMVAPLAQLPAVLLVLSLAALLYGWYPPGLPLLWLVIGYGYVVGFFAPILDIPDSMVDVSPFEHIGWYPQEEVSWPAFTLLFSIAVVVLIAALATFRRRDLITK